MTPSNSKNKFKRGLTENALDRLRNIAFNNDSHWWKDLLSLWKPSGVPAGDNGLRLAVRHNYLSFYYAGQTVAEVRFHKNHDPYAKIHHKYISEKFKGQDHAKLENNQEIVLPDGSPVKYVNIKESILPWINRIKQSYGGVEKCFVDELISANSLIIDLEMALPSYDGKKNADRIDCIALEKRDQNVAIIFWEVKRIDDGRLVLKTDDELWPPKICKPSEKNVIDQITKYKTYLSDADRASSVRESYLETCKLLVEFSLMAEKFGPKPMLDPLVIKVAASGVVNLHDVNSDNVRLVIIEGDCRAGKAKRPTAWKEHAAALTKKEIWYAVASNPDEYLLSTLVPQ